MELIRSAADAVPVQTPQNFALFYKTNCFSQAKRFFKPLSSPRGTPGFSACGKSD
jgi:hypothetical protein